MKNRKDSDHYSTTVISMERLSAFMGISVNELFLLDTVIFPVRDLDGSVMAFMVEFTHEVPAAIKKRITRLVDDRYVYILVNEIKITDASF